MNDDTRFTEVDAAVDAVQRATPDSPSAEAVTRARAAMASELSREARPEADAGAASAQPALHDEASYIALIPDYLAGRLSESRPLLFEEESRRSLAVRRALRAAREAPVATTAPR